MKLGLWSQFTLKYPEVILSQYPGAFNNLEVEWVVQYFVE